MSIIAILVIVSAVLVVLSIIIHFFTPGSRARVPAIITSTVGGLGAGLGLGIVMTAMYGDQWNPPGANLPEALVKASGGVSKKGAGNSMPGPGMAGGGMGLMGMPKGMGMGGGGQGPNPKNQLASLISKLDLLTGSGLLIKLNDEQKKALREPLQALDSSEDLATDEAEKQLDAILEILKDQRPTLEAAGFRWPGSGGGFGGRPVEVPNPFKIAPVSQSLKSLQATVGSSPGEQK
jgi:hypothetical protein